MGSVWLTLMLVVGALAGDSERSSTRVQPTTNPPEFERNLRDAATKLGRSTVQETANSAEPAAKAGYTVDWYNISNNGGTNTAASTNYSWDATVGQGLAGSTSSTNWSWDVGFWFTDGPAGGCLSSLAGDVNVTGNLNTTDIIVLVNYVLKAGPLPQPCVANGDATCSCGVNSTEINFLVNYVLKAGPPPCDICNDSPLPCI
jgi:hypothetical protein